MEEWGKPIPEKHQGEGIFTQPFIPLFQYSGVSVFLCSRVFPCVLSRLFHIDNVLWLLTSQDSQNIIDGLLIHPAMGLPCGSTDMRRKNKSLLQFAVEGQERMAPGNRFQLMGIQGSA